MPLNVESRAGFPEVSLHRVHGFAQFCQCASYFESRAGLVLNPVCCEILSLRLRPHGTCS